MPVQQIPIPAQQQNNVGSTLPISTLEDTRIAVKVELTKQFDNHALIGQGSSSTEEDYQSYGIAIKDAISLNNKNTTLTPGFAFTHDRIDVFLTGGTDTRNTTDLFLGLTQLLSPKTLFTANLTLGHSSGYHDDPYKVVELNGALIPEKRPDNRTKQILYLSLNHFFDALNAAGELSYRYYNDSFGIQGHTMELA